MRAACQCDGECGLHAGFCEQIFVPCVEIGGRPFPQCFGWNTFCDGCRSAQARMLFPEAVRDVAMDVELEGVAAISVDSAHSPGFMTEQSPIGEDVLADPCSAAAPNLEEVVRPERRRRLKRKQQVVESIG